MIPLSARAKETALSARRRCGDSVSAFDSAVWRLTPLGSRISGESLRLGPEVVPSLCTQNFRECRGPHLGRASLQGPRINRQGPFCVAAARLEASGAQEPAWWWHSPCGKGCHCVGRSGRCNRHRPSCGGKCEFCRLAACDESLPLRHKRGPAAHAQPRLLHRCPWHSLGSGDREEKHPAGKHSLRRSLSQGTCCQEAPMHREQWILCENREVSMEPLRRGPGRQSASCGPSPTPPLLPCLLSNGLFPVRVIL